jgi:hypothetical protein
VITTAKRENLIGQKFNSLTVIERNDTDLRRVNSKHKKIYWWCKCDCGNENLISVQTAHLKNGSTKSCGCLHLKTSKINGHKNKKFNTYDLTGEYGIGYTFKGEKFYFDLEDYDKIKDYCWSKRKDGYLYAKKCDGNNKHILMHKLIISQIYQIDHINGIRHDNRKINLRNANLEEINKNNRNKIKLRNNTSGVTGVIWHNRDSIWEVRIGVDNKQIYLGRNKDFNKAVDIRKAAEEKYFGEWSYNNSRNKNKESD